MKHVKNYEEAEILAIEALGFIAKRENTLKLFLDLSGLNPHELRSMASKRSFFSGIVQFLLTQEAILVEFSQENSYDPMSIEKAASFLL